MAAKEIHPVLVTATSEADQTLLEAGSDPALLQLQPQSGRHEAPIELLGEVQSYFCDIYITSSHLIIIIIIIIYWGSLSQQSSIPLDLLSSLDISGVKY